MLRQDTGKTPARHRQDTGVSRVSPVCLPCGSRVSPVWLPRASSVSPIWPRALSYHACPFLGLSACLLARSPVARLRSLGDSTRRKTEVVPNKVRKALTAQSRQVGAKPQPWERVNRGALHRQDTGKTPARHRQDNGKTTARHRQDTGVSQLSPGCLPCVSRVSPVCPRGGWPRSCQNRCAKR